MTDERKYEVEVLKNTEWFYLPKGVDIKLQLMNETPEIKEGIREINFKVYGDNFRLAFPYRNKME